MTHVNNVTTAQAQIDLVCFPLLLQNVSDDSEHNANRKLIYVFCSLAALVQK